MSPLSVRYAQSDSFGFLAQSTVRVKKRAEVARVTAIVGLESETVNAVVRRWQCRVGAPSPRIRDVTAAASARPSVGSVRAVTGGRLGALALR